MNVPIDGVELMELRNILQRLHDKPYTCEEAAQWAFRYALTMLTEVAKLKEKANPS